MKQENKLTCEQVRQWDLVDYLSALGHEPTKIRGNDYWYLSPLRNEKTASFKVNRKKNVWYDHGDGRGGDFIGFAIRYHDCTIGELLQLLSGSLSFQTPAKHSHTDTKEEETKIELQGEYCLSSVSLLLYLKQRRVPAALAEKYCKEVRFKMAGKTYYGIAFKNDSDGYEIRTPFLKTSISPKDIRSIKSGQDKVAVFEGFFDFLSFLFIMGNLVEFYTDFIILNSLSFFEKARPLMEAYKEINLYLDNDNAGQNCSRYAVSLDKKYCDRSAMYKDYKDVNAWLMREKTSSG